MKKFTHKCANNLGKKKKTTTNCSSIN
jgi:hypothetical protein